MQRWLPKVVSRIRILAEARKVRFTLKSRRELAELAFGLDEEDACDVLATITVEDSGGRSMSKSTGEWMYVFKPELVGMVLYVKVILRSDCVVVSFHEDEGDTHEEEDS
jgi:MqsR (Motility quorum-sensing regulator) toxin of toxin-antitoxin system